MNNKLVGDEKNIIFYNDANRNLNIEVLLQDENVWLNVNAIASLFGVQRPNLFLGGDEVIEKSQMFWLF